MQNNLQVVIPQNNLVDTGRNVLYLSDLPQNVTDSDLEMFFSDYKDSIVFSSIMSGSKQSDLNKKVAKVIFKDSKTADEARKAKNMTKIKGRTVRVMWEEKDKSSRYNSGANLFIKNIPFSVKPREFFELFLQFGDISSSKLPEDDNGHLGYGYISYYDRESALKAIKALDGKETWGAKLDVNFFQKKNERLGSYGVSNNSLYVKNFPSSFDENEIKKLFSQFGIIESVKISSDDQSRRFAIVTFNNELACSSAKNSLIGTKFQDGSELFVDHLMNKQERKKILSNKIMDTNSKLNEQYKLCNLHIRNIPYHAKEEDIIEAFKKFGEIKSVKIEKLILVTKENNEIKEIPTSKGFGYICFEEPQSAQRALEEMNDKFLPKFETWKRPLIIEYFMPKMQRTPVVVDKINQTSVFNTGKFSMIYGQNPSSYGMQPVQPGMMNFPPQMMNYAGGMNPQMYKPQRNYQQPYRQQHHQQPYQQQYQPQQQTVNNPPQKRIIVEKKEEEKDELDYKYLESLDYESKKDYLGEFIFKKIENHKLSQNNSLTIDMIGKITGMILGIEDISEIIEIYRSSENLTARITEALDLITKN